MILFKLNSIAALSYLLHKASLNLHADAFHIGAKQQRSFLRVSSITRTAPDKRRRNAPPPPMTKENNRMELVRRFYQSNDEHMNMSDMSVNISIRDVRTGFQGKPASSSAEDLELTRKIIMNKWDIELTRQIIMGRMEADNMEVKVDMDVQMDIGVVDSMKCEYHDASSCSPNNAFVDTGAETKQSDIQSGDIASSPKINPIPVESVPPNIVRRASIRGVSISPSGFLILVMTQAIARSTQYTNDNEVDDGTTHRITLPIGLTSNPQDAMAATSAESLTMCQLLTGIDMAGTIFNPEVLQDIVGLYCSPDEEDDYDNEKFGEDVGIIVEDELGLDTSDADDDINVPSATIDKEPEAELRPKSESSVREYIRTFLQMSLAKQFGDGSVNSYQGANRSERSSIVFPKVTLDSVTIDLPLFDSDKTYEENKAAWKEVVWKEGERLVEVSESSNRNENTNSPNENTLIPLPLQFVLECRIEGDKTLHVPIYNQIATMQHNHPHLYYKEDTNDYDMERIKEILQEVLYDYDDDCSGAFVALALALRYKCPIGITSGAIEAVEEIQSQLDGNESLQVCMMKKYAPGAPSSASVDCECDEAEDSHEMNDDEAYAYNIFSNSEDDDTEITSILPDYKSTSSLHSQSQRVGHSIEKGFQLSKLKGALKIAIEKGDVSAEEKIRNEISKLLDDM